MGKTLLGTLLGRFRTRDIDVLGPFRNLGKDCDSIRKHFGKPEGYDEIVSLLADSVPELTNLERREHRGVTRKDAEVAFATRQHYFVDLFGDERALGRYDFERQLRR